MDDDRDRGWISARECTGQVKCQDAVHRRRATGRRDEEDARAQRIGQDSLALSVPVYRAVKEMVTSLPRVTVAGALPVRVPSRVGSAETCVLAEPELSAGLASVSFSVALAVKFSVPAAVAVTTTVSVELAPTAIVPRSNVRMPWIGVTPPVADTKTTPAGTGVVKVTPVAPAVPLLVTVRVYVTSVPRVVDSGALD